MKNRLSIIAALCLIIVFTQIFLVNANAVYGEFVTSEISEDKVAQIWNSLNIQEISDSQLLSEVHSPIVSFDVSPDRNIIVGLKNKKILILNDSGSIQRCYSFENEGSFCVQWKGNNILLFLVRGSTIVEFSLDGALVNIADADVNLSNNNKQWNQLIGKRSMTVGGDEYRIHNDWGIFNFLSFQTFSKLTRTDAEGNISTLYNISNTQLLKIIACIVGFLLLILIVIIMIPQKRVIHNDNCKQM